MIDSIHRELTVDAPIDRVWQAITNPVEVARWFGSDAHFELREGAQGYFEWQQECEGRFAMQIEKIQPSSYFAWRWMLKQDVPFAQTDATLVEWYLQPERAGGTRIQLTESGFASAKHREMNVQGWEQELADLRDYLAG